MWSVVHHERAAEHVAGHSLQAPVEKRNSSGDLPKAMLHGHQANERVERISKRTHNINRYFVSFEQHRLHYQRHVFPNILPTQEIYLKQCYMCINDRECVHRISKRTHTFKDVSCHLDSVVYTTKKMYFRIFYQRRRRRLWVFGTNERACTTLDSRRKKKRRSTPCAPKSKAVDSGASTQNQVVRQPYAQKEARTDHTTTWTHVTSQPFSQ